KLLQWTLARAVFFFFQAEDGIRDFHVTGVQTCALPILMKPYLVSAIREYGNDVQTFSPIVLEEKIASDEVIAQLQECLKEVVLTGTGKSIRSPYYQIAGKTGTAQVADMGIKYSDRVYQGSFVGYFPADNPQYTVAVVIRTRPRSSAYYGGT